MSKSAEAFRTISEAATELDVPQHVLRFWESKFGQIRPMKRGGGRRYYRPSDIELLRGVRSLLYDEGYTIKGVQKLFREHGVKYVGDVGRRVTTGDAPPPLDPPPPRPTVSPPSSKDPTRARRLTDILDRLRATKDDLDAAITESTKAQGGD